jgi:hypothetical protein
MHKSKPPHDSFASYFNYLEQIQDKKLNTLEPIKKKIVDLVFMNTKNGVFWTVTQYANEKSLGSLITIHRNIHELIAEDYLVIAFLNGKRHKTILLGNKGSALVNDLGNALLKSAH